MTTQAIQSETSILSLYITMFRIANSPDTIKKQYYQKILLN